MRRRDFLMTVAGATAVPVVLATQGLAASQEAVDDQAAQALLDAFDEVCGLVDACTAEHPDAKVALTLEYLDGTAAVSVNDRDSFRSASMIKLLVLAELLNRVDAGDFALADKYEIPQSCIVGGDGYIYPISKGAGFGIAGDSSDAERLVFTLDDIARLMIMASDNTATNFLIDLLGMDAVNARATALGLQTAHLGRHMMEVPDHDENYLCCADAATILRGIYERTLASPQMCNKAELYLLSQMDSTALGYGFDGAAVKFAHKCGELDLIRHDGGIVYARHPFILVVFTSGLTCDEGNALMNDVSVAVAARLCP